MARIDHLDSLRETAAHWRERASDDGASAETRGALNSWLAQSPEHTRAYRSIERAWSTLRSAAENPAILELRQEAARRLPPAASTDHGQLRWVAVALIMLFLGASLWIIAPRAGFSIAWLKSEPQTAIPQTYATMVGDRLTIALDDGSHVTLNTATQLDVALSKKARTVRLVHGQALFEVAKDASRPFVVQTQNHRFIAVGTAFDVHIETDQVKLTMLEGTVRAEGIEPGGNDRTTVTAGQQLIATAHAHVQVHRINPEHETSWRRGQAIFENTRLAEAIDELNRYSTRHIVLGDAKLADLRISGTFDTGRTSAFVEAMTAYFPIEIDHRDEQNVTLKARP